MEYEYREISEERCQEIDSWKIQDMRHDRIFTAEKKYFVTNADETNMFCCAFIPKFYEMDEGEGQCAYLLIIDKSYYIINYNVEDIITYDDTHQLFIINIMEKDYINENRNRILNILKKVIPVYMKKSRMEMPNENFGYKFFYKGEEI